MTNPPSGTVTFLFTDIQGSTKLAQEQPDKWELSRERHHSILREAIESNNGYVFQIIGDAFCAAFHKAGDALQAALQAQIELTKAAWGEAVIKVRMGIHTGEAEIKEDGQYNGYLTMSRVQRLMSAGHGGQVLISTATHELIRDKLPKETSLRDLGEKRLKDLIRPERLYQLVFPGLIHDFPPLKTLDLYRHNLPTQLTTFIGREKEIAEIKQELSNHRLVTLTGSGGTGKTRLSLQIAADVLDSYPDGAWFVELASLSDPELFSQTILSVLGNADPQGKSALKALEEFLQDRKILIVLDNCEHLITAAAQTADTILKAAPNLKILASSREALGVKGELAWHVPSLSLPNPKKLPELEQLTQYEAVQLFIDRALLVQPRFTVDTMNAPAVAQICHRLDGIPLALELAAARVKMLSVEQISARLDDRFRLLTGGARTALPRQQTLRSMIDWSYDLLSDSEKLLLRRLAVFAGGWTLELAEQVCSDEKIDQYEILDMLGKLVDKSLVAVVQDKTGTRYHILETVRQYAREKLLESGEGMEIRNKHRAVYLAFVERIEPELIRTQQKKWLNVLESEIDNLRAAFNWSLENKDAEQAIRFCSSLGNFWGKNNHSAEAVSTSKQALALANENDSLNTSFWYAATLLAYVVFAGEWKSFSDPSLLPLLEQAHNIFNSINNYSTTAPLLAFAFLANAYIDLNDLASAERCLLDMYEKVKTSDYQWGKAWTKQAMAELSMRKGDKTSWMMLSQEALELFTECGDEWSVKEMSEILIWQKHLRGEIEDATRLTKLNILLYEKDGEPDRIARCYNKLGTFAFFQGQYETARRYFSDATDIYMEHGFLAESTLPQENIAFLLYKEGKLEGARAEYQMLITQLKDFSDSFLIGFTHARYALVHLSEGHLSEAWKSLEIALGILKKVAPEDDICHAYFGLGELTRLEENYPEAIKNYRASLYYANNYFNYKSFPTMFDGIAKSECLQSNFDKAARLFGASEALSKKMGAVIHPVDRLDYDKHIELLKSKLGVEEFESAWAKGATMSIEETYQYARQDGEE